MGCRWLRIIFVVVALIALCGCGTITSRTKGLGRPYSGFGYDMEKLSSAEGWFGSSAEGNASDIPLIIPGGVLWALDIPLSLVADTLLLPVDAVRGTRSEAEASP